MFDLILNLIFPPRCIFCGVLIYPVQLACDKCSKLLPYVCESYDKFFNINVIKNVHVDQNISCFFYEGLVKNAIYNFKFGGKKCYHKNFSKFLYKSIQSKYKNIHFDLVTFVPSTKKQLKKRGYNQTELLAKDVSKFLKVPLLKKEFIKIRENKNQHKLNLNDRVENIKNVYTVLNAKIIKNKTILIIEDIITTGVTLNECAMTLKNFGANKVCAATIAVTMLKN